VVSGRSVHRTWHPATRRLRHDPVLLGLGASAVVLATWFVLIPAGIGTRVAIYWIPQPLLDVALLVLCRRVASTTAASAAIRRFWRWLGRAGILFAIGDGFQALTAIVHPGLAAATGGPIQSAFVAGGVAMTVGVVLTHPTGVTGAERVRLWLDASTVMVGAGVFVWYLNGGGASSLAGLGVATLVLVAVFGLVRLTLGHRPPFTLGAGIVGITGVASFGILTALEPVMTASPRLGPELLVRLLPSMLISATPRVQELQIRADPTALSTARRRPYSLLPYLAVAATQVLLVRVLWGEQLTVRGRGVIFGVIIITALVVVRQLAAFSDNAGLLTRLDASMLELRRQEQRFRSLVQHASDITVIIGVDGVITYASPAILATLGIPPEQAVGRSVLRLLDPADMDQARALSVQLRAAERSSLDCLIRGRHADGTLRWLDVIATNLLTDPSVQGMVCNARDVTEDRRMHERLHHQASHDPLTQLANRASFEERLNAALASPDRLDSMAVLMIDLDDFKPINDTFGHHAGDELLIQVAARLRRVVRSQDTVARLGGDEFAVLMPGATREHAVAAAERVIGSVADHILAAGHRLSVRASVGVAIGTLEEANTLLRDADAAMYVAKRSGKGHYHCAQAVS
jgi:diguanylate cyclase (GGDEF)-like protein/PAS domain S-box-containing protein